MYVTKGPIQGQRILEALDRHSGSLRRLVLSGLRQRTLVALNQLRNCKALEGLSLGTWELDADLPNFDFAWSETAVYNQVVEWLQNCSQQTDLTLRLPSGTQLLKELLTGPKLRLESLEVVEIEVGAPWYNELHHQARLKSLDVRVPNSGLRELGPASGRCQGLAIGISRCSELTALVTEEYLSVADITKISEGALKLERIDFSGTLIHDAHIMPLANLSHLKEVVVRGVSTFTASGIIRFLEKMGENPDHDHKRFYFFTDGAYGATIGPEDYRRMCETAERVFRGKLTIGYIDKREYVDGEDDDHNELNSFQIAPLTVVN